MKNLSCALCLTIAMLLLLAGCSTQNGNPVTPAEPAKSADSGNHYTWGLWQFKADLSARTLDVVPLRTGNFHLNALPFLEPPPLVNLTLESIKFTGNKIDADIGLRHPFLGLTEFTGFDVCGILITNGFVTGFGDTDLRMAGAGDTRLLNSDAYSRWWNPAEFPYGATIFTYKDGLLGTPDSIGDYNSTLNGYKYYADELGPNDPLGSLIGENRGVFSAGQKNIRHYTIEIGTDGLVFNYAVDACWHFPTGDKPWTAPDDFPPEANRQEAYNIDVTETHNSLIPGGGTLGLEIKVFDWYGAASNEVTIESLGAIDPVTVSAPDSVGEGYAIYSVNATDCHPASSGDLDIFITVKCEATGYGGILPGKPVASYFTYTTTVLSDIPVNYNLVLTIERDANYLITGIKLDWDDNAGVTGYNIYRQNPFDASDDWVLLPASPVTESEYIDTDIVGNEAYQYKVVAKVGANEVSKTSVEAYAILQNAEDNVNTHCVWGTCAFPIMYNPNNLPWSLFNEFAPLNQTPQNGQYCWDEGGLQNGPGDPGTYWTGSATLFATPVLPLPTDAVHCEAEFCVRLNNVPTGLPPDFHICGVTVGVTNVVEDGPNNPFVPSQEYIEGLDYNAQHVQGFSDYGNFTNITSANDKGFAYQVDPPPPWENIKYKYSKFALPDVFTISDARAALAWGCANSAGGTGAPNAGSSFDDIAILLY